MSCWDAGSTVMRVSERPRRPLWVFIGFAGRRRAASPVPWVRASHRFHTVTMPQSVMSLDSLSSDGSYDSDDERLAQEEWEESLEQLAQLVSVVLLPFFGKWLGRRWSYWGGLPSPSSHRPPSHRLTSFCSICSIS